MRVLNVSAYFEAHRGGVEIVAGQLVRALAKRGLKAAWFSTAVDGPPDDVQTISAAACNLAEQRLGFPWPVIGPTGLGRLWRAIGDHDVVLVHDCLYPTSIAAFASSRLRRKPVLIVQHVGEVPYRNPVLRLLMRLANWIVARPMLSRADQVVFISRLTSTFFANVGFRRPPQHIFNGVDAGTFRPARGQAERDDLRRRLGLPVSGPIALFVGRFVEKKGLPVLRRAAVARPDLTWAFAGWGDEDPEEWGLSNVRVFRDLSGVGLAELYRSSDVLVLPSVGEGFPLVIQEALSCGLPVVCGEATVRSDEAAAPFLVGAALGVAEPVEGFLSALDAAFASALQPRARAEFAAARYSWSAAADQYIELLGQISSRPAAMTGAQLARSSTP